MFSPHQCYLGSGNQIQLLVLLPLLPFNGFLHGYSVFKLKFSDQAILQALKGPFLIAVQGSCCIMLVRICIDFFLRILRVKKVHSFFNLLFFPGPTEVRTTENFMCVCSRTYIYMWACVCAFMLVHAHVCECMCVFPNIRIWMRYVWNLQVLTIFIKLYKQYITLILSL